MEPRARPVVVGAAAGLVGLVLPSGLGTVVLVVAALLAGWVLPREPMLAAVLFFVPAIVVGAVRVALDDGAPGVGPLVLALVFAVVFVAILTHLGAGLALRRGRGTHR